MCAEEGNDRLKRIADFRAYFGLAPSVLLLPFSFQRRKGEDVGAQRKMNLSCKSFARLHLPKMLQRPFRVMVVGQSGVGKSGLFHSLASIWVRGVRPDLAGGRMDPSCSVDHFSRLESSYPSLFFLTERFRLGSTFPKPTVELYLTESGP